MRKQLDRHMMRPSIVTSYLDDFNEVTTDFIQFVRARRGNDGLMDGLDEQLFRWSLEGMSYFQNFSLKNIVNKVGVVDFKFHFGSRDL